MNKINYKALLTWVLIGTGFGWTLNSLVDQEAANGSTQESTELEEQVDLSLLWDVWSALEENYFDTHKLETQAQVYGAIEGLVESLDDPYTVFMDPDETESFHQSLEGEFEGIGAELTVEDGLLTVVSPLKGSPAEEAGLLPKDIIYMVDGKPTSDMTLFDAIQSIRGEPNTEVKLIVIREGADEPIEITILRQKINVPSVELEFNEQNGKNIAYMTISQFGDNTNSEFRNAVAKILISNVDSLILDLRFNGGGYLEASVDILSEFFEEKEKAVIVKKRNESDEIIYTYGNGQLTSVPMVVLINEGSASASEIVAGAMQDYKRAVVMGVTSYGKGSVQELSQLNDGSSLRMTIAKWYTPNDRTIDQTGITPDVIIEMESSEANTENDTQLKSALEYLGNL